MNNSNNNSIKRNLTEKTTDNIITFNHCTRVLKLGWTRSNSYTLSSCNIWRGGGSPCLWSRLSSPCYWPDSGGFWRKDTCPGVGGYTRGGPLRRDNKSDSGALCVYSPMSLSRGRHTCSYISPSISRGSPDHLKCNNVMRICIYSKLTTWHSYVLSYTFGELWIIINFLKVCFYWL